MQLEWADDMRVGSITCRPIFAVFQFFFWCETTWRVLYTLHHVLKTPTVPTPTSRLGEFHRFGPSLHQHSMVGLFSLLILWLTPYPCLLPYVQLMFLYFFHFPFLKGFIAILNSVWLANRLPRALHSCRAFFLLLGCDSCVSASSLQ